MYRSFSPYDDEGYIMLTVKQFQQGHHLYGEIFSQYGPFYYLYKSVLHSLTGLPVTHDSTRLFTLGSWLAIPLICALAIYWVTRSIAVSAVAQVLVFGVLRASTLEPGHPVDICAVLLAIGMLLCCFVRQDNVGLNWVELNMREPNSSTSNWVFAGFGVIFGALALTKINLGAFWAIAIGIALLAYGPKTFLNRAATGAAVAAGIALPFVLMRPYLSRPGISDFAQIVALSFAACFACAFPRIPRLFGWKNSGVTIGAAAATIFAITLFIYWRGTPPYMLLRGVLLDPWHWVGTFLLINQIAQVGVLYAALGAAIGLFSATRFSRLAEPAAWSPWIVVAMKGAYGIAILACVVKFFSWSLFPSNRLISYGIPFVFLALLPNPGKLGASIPFYRLAWCLIAVFQTLQGYPVAGTDAAFSVFPTVMIAAVCSWDFCEALAPVLQQFLDVEVLVRAAEASLVAAILTICLGLGATARSKYLANEPLNLRGAMRLRLPGEIAERYQRLTNDIAHNSDIFIGLPGMESFYFWAGQEPPTCRNVGLWMTALPARDQEQIIRTLDQHSRAAVLYSPELVNFWTHGAQQQSDLEAYIFAHFQTVDSRPKDHGYWHDSFQFMMRKEEADKFVAVTGQGAHATAEIKETSAASR